MRTVIGRWLKDEGYDNSEAGSAAEAWEHLQQNEVHLVTLDITMPGTSGAQLLPRIKAAFPDVEVIMLTALEETNLAIETLTRGAHAYLIKPVKAEELLLQVRKALEHRDLRIANRRYTHELERKVREQTETIRRVQEETILRLASASQYRDEETGAHIQRTGLFSALMAEVLGWPVEQVDNIRMAAPMHDVGKIGIPDAVLQKPGKLTAEEFEIMKTHAEIGAQMLADSASPMLQMAHDIALCHHERWDGHGYPRGLCGAAIPETARIVALMDVYDALTHNRIYRAALPEEEALTIMEQERDTHFDPSLFSVFLALLPELRLTAAAHPDQHVTGYVRRRISL
jgi:putative two-component system response regulator